MLQALGETHGEAQHGGTDASSGRYVLGLWCHSQSASLGWDQAPLHPNAECCVQAWCWHGVESADSRWQKEQAAALAVVASDLGAEHLTWLDLKLTACCCESDAVSNRSASPAPTALNLLQGAT